MENFCSIARLLKSNHLLQDPVECRNKYDAFLDSLSYDILEGFCFVLFSAATQNMNANHISVPSAEVS